MALISILPPNTNLSVTTRLIDVLEDEVDEKYYLSEEKTKKLTLNEDLSGRLNHYDYRDVDSVHSTEKVSPTLNTMQGGDKQPKIAVKEATKKGYTEAMEGDSVNTSFPNSKTRRGRVGKQVAQTLQAGDVNQGVVIDDTQNFDGVRMYRKIAPTLRSGRSGLKTIVADRKQKGIRTTEDGFHTYRKDDKKSSVQGTHVTYKEGKTHALTSNHVPMTLNNLRIRKLTPLETWRLQGFTDEQFYKAKNAGVSKSQLYKQAGNAVTVNVVDAIVGELE
ncbi:DNA cytosine methyltransferase [Staphylococcus haemolyticus]